MIVTPRQCKNVRRDLTDCAIPQRGARTPQQSPIKILFRGINTSAARVRRNRSVIDI